jgi:hypothetical protein
MFGASVDGIGRSSGRLRPKRSGRSADNRPRASSRLESAGVAKPSARASDPLATPASPNGSPEGLPELPFVTLTEMPPTELPALPPRPTSDREPCDRRAVPTPSATRRMAQSAKRPVMWFARIDVGRPRIRRRCLRLVGCSRSSMRSECQAPNAEVPTIVRRARQSPACRVLSGVWMLAPSASASSHSRGTHWSASI